MSAKKASTTTINIVTVTPKIAAEYLERNFRNNRPIKPARVATYANDMRNGNWIQTGEPIKFAVDGTLIDGQHRLSAIIEAKCSVTMVVVEGLPVLSMRQMDTAVSRSLADALAIESFENPKELAASLSSFASYEAYMEDKFGDNSEPIVRRRRDDRRPYRRFSNSVFARSAAFNMLERRPGIIETVQTVKPLCYIRKNQMIAPPIGVAALLHNISKHGDGTGAAIEYIEAVREGAGDLMDPAHQLNKLLTRSKLARAGERGRMSGDAIAASWFRGYDIWTGNAEPVAMRIPKYRSYPTIEGDVEWYLAGKEA